jgi:hypothetical protein
MQASPLLRVPACTEDKKRRVKERRVIIKAKFEVKGE